MKYIVTSIIVVCSSVCIAYAQTTTTPRAPSVPATPKVPAGVLPKSPCDAEMKAAAKNIPKIEPGKDPKSMPKPDINSKEAKALQDCLKKNAPKGGAAAPVKPPSGSADAKIPDPTQMKVKAPSAGTPPAAPQKNGLPPAGKAAAPATTVLQCPSISKALQVGTRDAEVIALKKFLTAEGLLQGVQNTDYFGAVTEKALKAWQQKKGIAQTGITDEATRAAIKNCAVQKATPAKTGTKK